MLPKGPKAAKDLKTSNPLRFPYRNIFIPYTYIFIGKCCNFVPELRQKANMSIPVDSNNKQTIKTSSRLLAAKWLPIAVFSTVAYLILTIWNNDYLYAVENHSLWLNSRHFLEERMLQPGGLMMWAGCYLTQYFHYPWLGALILVALWVLVYWLTIKAFRLEKGNCILALLPVTALLCSEIDLGYWLYYIKIPGYWFTESIGVAFTLLAIYLGRLMKPWLRIAWMIVFCLGGYAIFGWYALLGTLVMLLPFNGQRSMVKNAIKQEQSRTCSSSAEPEHFRRSQWSMVNGQWSMAIMAIIATPLLWYHHYTSIRIEDIWLAAFPLFQANNTFSILPSIPFIIIAIAFVVLPFLTIRNSKILNLVTTLACCAMVYVFWFTDSNYHAELHMMRALEQRDWNSIIETAREQKAHPTRQMILVRNLALLNTNRLGDEMFTFDNETVLPATYDSLKVRMVKTAAPEIYLQYGKTNFCYRWCIENGVEYGFNVIHLRHMAKTCILNKEPNLALKYINLLKRTTFHKKEAMRLEAMVFNPSMVEADEEMKAVINLIDANDMLDADNSACDLYLTQYFSQVTSHNPVMADLVTSYTLFVKNNDLFWTRFMNYGILHEGEHIPLHYLEAAYLFGNIDNNPIFDDLQFDLAMVQSYSNFQISMYNLKQKGFSEKEIAAELKKTFGKTYWWYYYFVLENKFY